MRHGDVGDDDVWAQGPGRLDQPAAVLDRADQIELRRVKARQRFGDEETVACEQHARSAEGGHSDSRFVLIALDDGVPDGELLFKAVTTTVALSVIAHGLTSTPLIGVYRRWYSAHRHRRPDAKEAMPAGAQRLRGQPERPAPTAVDGAAGS